MPHYDYFCSNCKTQLQDVYQSITEKAIIHCKECDHNTLERMICSPMVFVRQEPTTIGQLSERNSQKLGRSEIQERTLRDKKSKEPALREAKNEIRSRINKMNEDQVQRYIENG